MIPEKLRLSNFLSHRDTELDFHGIHLATLVGENGAGKSALLDAMTWAIWQKSRASSEEDLIFHGETDLQVEFEFRMPYQGGDDRRFRILRRRQLKGQRTTTSLLDFQVDAGGEWRNLSGDSIRETENRIAETLGLDYKTFVNSAYLRQGHADEFTVLSATERKKILSTILGLDQWAVYQERAKTSLNMTQGQVKEIDQRLKEIENELAHRPEFETKLIDAEEEALAAASELSQVQERLQDVLRLQEQADALKREIASAEARQLQERGRLNKLMEAQATHTARHHHFAELLARSEEIKQRYASYQQLQQDERAWNEKLQESSTLQQEQNRYEREIARAHQQLLERLRDLEKRINGEQRVIEDSRAALEKSVVEARSKLAAKEGQYVDAALLADLAREEQTLAEFDVRAAELEQVREDAGVIDQELSKLSDRNQNLLKMRQELTERLAELQTAEAICPLCKQPLNEEHRQHAVDDFTSQDKTMGEEYRANEGQTALLLDKKRDQQQKQAQLAAVLRTRPAQEQKVARLRQRVEQDREAREHAVELRRQLERLESMLGAGDYAPEPRARLQQLEEQRSRLQADLDNHTFAPEARAALARAQARSTALGYDRAAHSAITSRLLELNDAEANYRELESARLGLEQETEALKQLDSDSAAQNALLRQLDGEQEERRRAADSLLPQLASLGDLSRRQDEWRRREAAARQNVGAWRQELASLDALEIRQQSLGADREQLARRLAVLTELRDAFGYNGIPAMIIEHTLPELEREANRILQQLTGGRMNLRFETQRELKSGDQRETLDIIISDEKGTRPYENFSGGEQFRINFAIRVALSRLLSQRAGIRLRSLFIDEGFGVLDADGRQRLVEAVKAVQDEFDLILVITHIEELRDSFPTQIHVTKTDGGSQVEVI